MLCRACHFWLPRNAHVCGVCGEVVVADAVAYDLVIADRRERLGELTTIGRAEGNTVRLEDPSVSRWHASICVEQGAATIEDVSSRFGTFVDRTRIVQPTRIIDGSRIRVGETMMVCERRRPSYQSGRLAVIDPVKLTGTLTGFAPDSVPAIRVRRRVEYQRLDADEGTRRVVLRDGERMWRLTEQQAEIVRHLDGRTTIGELRQLAREQLGSFPDSRLYQLFVELRSEGLLYDPTEEDEPETATRGRAAKVVAPRYLGTDRTAGFFETLYRAGAWVLFTLPVLVGVAALAVCGLPVFVAELLSGPSTPLLVGDSLSWGALALLAGRIVLVIAHELAHGLALTALGRKVTRGGLKFVLVFPYAFVDTSEAWFKRRRHRIAVSAAGPASDLVLGAAGAILTAALNGAPGDVAFQFAIAAYLNAFFNLNPLLERDGYHILIDVLDQPCLRSRSRAAFAGWLAGEESREVGGRTLRRYTLASLAWTLFGVGTAVVSLNHHRDALEPVLGASGTSVVIAAACAALTGPLLALYGPAVYARFRTPRAEVTRGAG
jgi:putative peptide zinc metalloprotease protein